MYKPRICKGLLILLALLIANGGLFAAGGEESEGSTITPPGIFGKYDPMIDIEWVKFAGQANIESINTKLNPVTGEVMGDTRWERLFRDELGINVTYKWIADAEHGGEKLRLMLASGDLPDVIPLGGDDQGKIQFTQLAEGGLIQDLTEVWEDYAAPLTKEVVEADGDVVYIAAMHGGKLMGIPAPKAGLDSYSYFWIRQDWLDKLGLDPPRTPEELMEVTRAFAKDDPDGNGVDDTYAMMMDKGLWYRSEGFFWTFDSYPDTWLKDGKGGLMYGAVQPETKDALAALALMHADGRLDPEWAVKDGGKANEMFAENRIGISYGGHWISYDFISGYENDPSIDWNCYAPPGINGKIPRGEIELGLNQLLVVREGYEHPAALVKTFNMYWEKLYGETGDYEYWGNDELMDGIWWIGPFASFHPWVNIPPYFDIQEVYAGTKKPEDLKGVSLDYYNNTENNPKPVEGWAWQKMFTDPDRSPFGNITKRIDEGNLFLDNFVSAPTETMIDRWATLQELQLNTFTRIIVGDLDVDDGFGEFVKSWKSLGGDKITAEISTWYRNALGN